MRHIGIIILLVLCLTLLLLTGCVVNTIISEATIGNLGNQEDTEEPEEPAEEPGTENPQKWSGLGMMLFYTDSLSEFDGYVDTLLDNGFTELRMGLDWLNWDTEYEIQAVIIDAITKGAQVIWGVESSGVTLTSSNWDDFADAVLAAAQWAQDNGVYEFQIGNEEELHNDDDTLTDAQLFTNLKVLATAVQAIFTNGNVSYSCDPDYISDWIAAGKGDLDILACNIYMGGDGWYEAPWEYWIDILVNAFGVDGTYLTEFSLSWSSLDDYSADEVVQATALTEMIEYIKASGMTRALFFCYKDPPWLSGFGALKIDGTYRLLWNQVLLNLGP